MANYVIWGGTGQAKVVRPILDAEGHVLVAVFDNNPGTPPPFPDRPLLGGREAFEAFRDGGAAEAFIVAVGGAHGRARRDLSSGLVEAGLTPLAAVHARAFVAATARLGRGCQVMAMAAVSEQSELGDFCIVNTSASVDHECRLGAGVHVMPGATLAGMVEVGEDATIGSNATVLPRVRIGAGAFVGAGAVVTRDVPDGATVVGAPARRPRAPGAARA